MSIRQLSILVFAVVLLPASSLYADKREDFFAANSARDVFTEEVLEAKDLGFEYFLPLQKKAIEEELEQEEEAVLVQPAAGTPSPRPSENEAELLKKYGDPAENMPILAIENAPRPFKAMMDAKAGGHDELAYQYAKQYARYIRDLKERNMYVVGMIGKAMQVEGMLPENAWPNHPRFDEQQRLVEKDLEKQAQARQNDPVEEVKALDLDDESKEMLLRALKEEGRVEGEKEPGSGEFVAGKARPEELDEMTERAKVRATYKGKVPLAPDGRVDVFVFFRPNAAGSLELLKETQELFKAYQGEQGVNIIGFSFEASAGNDLFKLRTLSRAQFPVRSGVDLAQRLGVRESPTYFLRASDSDEVIRISGSRSFYFLDEIIKTMRGGR